jgi:hypothetical protein
MKQSDIHKSEEKEKLVIDFTEDDNEWIERIGKLLMRYVMIRLAISLNSMNNILVSSWNLIMLRYRDVVNGLSNDISMIFQLS